MIGLIIICVLIASFFILVITLLCKSYTKDIIELEERLLQLEKRVNECEKGLNKGIFKNLTKEELEQLKKYDNEYRNWIFNPYDHGLNIFGESFNNPKKKEGDETMACKKGRGGRKK